MNEEQAYAVIGGRGSMTVFEIYIKTTPERLWEAITDPEMRAKYSFGVRVESDWTQGSEYRSGVPGVIEIASGENLEACCAASDFDHTWLGSKSDASLTGWRSPRRRRPQRRLWRRR